MKGSRRGVWVKGGKDGSLEPVSTRMGEPRRVAASCKICCKAVRKPNGDRESKMEGSGGTQTYVRSWIYGLEGIRGEGDGSPMDRHG